MVGSMAANFTVNLGRSRFSVYMKSSLSIIIIIFYNIKILRMRRIYFTLAALFAVATSYAKSAVPEINIPSSFKVVGSVNSWDGSKLTSVQGATGTLFADSQRNKALIHQKVEVPLFGLADAKVLIDFTTGEALTHIPFLSVCQLD